MTGLVSFGITAAISTKIMTLTSNNVNVISHSIIFVSDCSIQRHIENGPEALKSFGLYIYIVGW